MARIFISHSSNNKEFVRRLSEDLRALGHSPWLDEWQIKVGDCILSSIQAGLQESDYIIVVLSPAAVASGWVEREWKDAYWTEVTAGRKIVLPVLLTDCEVPNLIRTKKYADFRSKYEIGLATLCQAILPPQAGVPWSGVIPPAPHAGLASMGGASQATGSGWCCKRWAGPFPWFEYHLNQTNHAQDSLCLT